MLPVDLPRLGRRCTFCTLKILTLEGICDLILFDDSCEEKLRICLCLLTVCESRFVTKPTKCRGFFVISNDGITSRVTTFFTYGSDMCAVLKDQLMDFALTPFR